MIKAEDLRIGDLVIVNENCSLEQGTIGKVSEVRSTPLYKENEGSIGLKPISNDRWPWGVLCRNIDPIPLTPEILEKNGYKDILYQKLPWTYYRKENSKVQVGYNCESDKNPFSVVKGRVGLKRVNYVHELQHILWALGLDANLKI